MTQKEAAPAALAGVAEGPNDVGSQGNSIVHSIGTGKQEVAPPDAPQNLPWPAPFRIGNDGIYKVGVDDKTQQETCDWIFSPLIIEARTCDQDEQNWGLLLKIQTPSGKWHRWAMPQGFLSGTAYREILFDYGLCIEHWAYKHLHHYLSSAKPQKRLWCVHRVGWFGGTYVLPDKSYGSPDSAEIILQSPMPIKIYRTKGTLEDWQTHIGRFCVGNSRLVFSVSVAFAAVMLKPCGLDGVGFHFVGNSSTGKSTLLTVASSICGGGGDNGFMRRWRTSDNALESWALAHNDNLLPLDEMSQVAPKAAAEIAYMLSNGQGKGRSGKDGVAKPVHEWRLLFLSNGEISLEQKLMEEGRRYMAGQAVRVLSIPADAQAGHGAFESLHGLPDGKSLSEYLQQAVALYYGTPLRAFLQAVTQDLAGMRREVLDMMSHFEREACPVAADGQVRRVAKRFALVAAAGELAARLQVMPWPAGAAFAASRRCLSDWITARGGLGAAEAREAILKVQDFLARHGSSRFSPISAAHERVIPNSAGYKKEEDGETLYLISPPVFRAEICAGGNHNAIARYLADAGFLEKRNDGRLCKNHNVPGVKNPLPLYTIRASILAGVDGEGIGSD